MSDDLSASMPVAAGLGIRLETAGAVGTVQADVADDRGRLVARTTRTQAVLPA